MIEIGREQLEEIRRHAEREYPHECCGLLVGRVEGEGRRRVVAATRPVTNAWDEGGELTHRMRIPPQDYLRAEREFAAQGLGVVGNYHSHPNHPAVPSEFDLEHLAPWPSMSCVVVSVGEEGARELRSWELSRDGSRFEEEEIQEVS